MTPSYEELRQENEALKLLLRDAHFYGQHAWSCATQMKRLPSGLPDPGVECDCWFNMTAKALVGDEEVQCVDGLLLVSKDKLECQDCGDLLSFHTARHHDPGEKKSRWACTRCNCKCMNFTHKGSRNEGHQVDPLTPQ